MARKMSIENFIQEQSYHHSFQPIYDIRNWMIAGYEGFLRSNDYLNPEFAFSDAKKAGRLYELDSQSIHKAIQAYQQAGYTRNDGFLFLNIFPSTIIDEAFIPFAKELMTDPHLINQQIVLEVSGLEEIIHFNEFKNCVKEIKELGFLLAVGDVGVGYSKVKSIIELEPDYIKLDRYFSYDLSTSNKKQSIIQLFNNFCKATGSKLILEGLETEITLALAKSLEIEYGQGYLLGNPKIIS